MKPLEQYIQEKLIINKGTKMINANNDEFSKEFNPVLDDIGFNSYMDRCDPVQVISMFRDEEELLEIALSKSFNDSSDIFVKLVHNKSSNNVIDAYNDIMDYVSNNKNTINYEYYFRDGSKKQTFILKMKGRTLFMIGKPHIVNAHDTGYLIWQFT